MKVVLAIGHWAFGYTELTPMIFFSLSDHQTIAFESAKANCFYSKGAPASGRVRRLRRDPVRGKIFVLYSSLTLYNLA